MLFRSQIRTRGRTLRKEALCVLLYDPVEWRVLGAVAFVAGPVCTRHGGAALGACVRRGKARIAVII